MVALRSEPVAATSPETLLAPSAPTSSRICTSPETALTVRSPVSPSTMMSPETVFSRASLLDARHERARAHDAEVESDGAGDRDADLGLRAARAEVAEHLEEVVPAQLRVVDLDGIAGDFDAEILDGDAVHLDAGAGFVVGDDVDLSADEADLERSDGFDVDHSSLAGVDDPLLQGHCFSSRVWNRFAIYRDDREITRYIACLPENCLKTRLTLT